MLSRIFKENFEIRNLEGEAVSQFVFSIASTITRIIQIAKIPHHAISDEGMVFYLELKMIADKKELMLKIRGIINRIIDYMFLHKGADDKKTAEEMLDFIHVNFDKDISLTELANSLNLSAGYASTLFKSITGENFKEYLNIYRVKRAKEKLHETPKIKIKDLSAYVGCNSTGTFIRIFKKYEGISPGKYIERELKQQNKKHING
ncbi:MAG: helix-turn-helix transcriptional regulator [Firmicutes bacterium]|nr:helix-turn-helix transcriptional regulator [Bacillota bacterium]